VKGWHITEGESGMIKKEHLIWAAIFLAGVYLSSPVKSGLRKVPVVGPKLPA
jgi:hypothetical protein